MKNSEQTIIFLHIPKTAGTTLYGLVWRHYEENELYTIDGVNHKLPDFRTLRKERKVQIRILTGHINFGIHEYLPQPAVYFTFLRDPSELVISYYYFVKGAIEHPHHSLIKANDMGLVDFLESRIDETMSNTQTRMLAGKAKSGSYYECTVDDLETAKRNLRESFAVIGLTEAFDETLLLLQKAFGWENLYYARMNVTRKRPQKQDASEDTLNAILQANKLDMELYQFARELFQQQVAKQGDAFIKEVQHFKRRNQRYYPILYAYWHARRQTALAHRRSLYRLRLLRARLYGRFKT